MRYFWSKLFAVACVACGCAVAVAAPLHDDRPVVRIGLVDTFSPEFYINTYAATVQYLKRQLPQYRFESVEFANDSAVTPQEVSKLDFLVSSAGARRRAHRDSQTVGRKQRFEKRSGRFCDQG